MRYYSIMRPIGPGTYPRVPGNKVLEIENFSNRKYIPEIDHDAWGCIEFSAPLDEKDARNYELIPAKEEST